MAKVMFFPVLPPHQCCFFLPTVRHILDAMACEGCRHLPDVEDDPGTESGAKSHGVGVPRAAIPKVDSAHSAHCAGRSEEDLYSGLSALEAARSGAGSRRRHPSDVKLLILRTQDLAELPPGELEQRITLTWRHDESSSSAKDNTSAERQPPPFSADCGAPAAPSGVDTDDPEWVAMAATALLSVILSLFVMRMII